MQTNESLYICTIVITSSENMNTIGPIVFVVLILIIIYFMGSVFDLDNLVSKLFNKTQDFD